MNRLSNEELTAIRERAERATEGPWKNEEVNEWYGTYYIWRSVDDRRAQPVARELTRNNAAFIAHAREDIPKLLAEIERLKSVVSEVITDNIYHETDEEFDEIYRQYLYGGEI